MTIKSMPRSQSSSYLISRMTALLWLVAIPVIAVVVLLWLGRSPEIFIAEVVESSVEPTDAGLVLADVRWTDGDGIKRVRTVELASELAASGSVGVVSEPDGEVRVLDPARETGPSVTVLVVTALMGLALAVVVLATVRGYGYVRGTGHYGEMDPHDVEESHGFYWRQ